MKYSTLPFSRFHPKRKGLESPQLQPVVQFRLSYRVIALVLSNSLFRKSVTLMFVSSDVSTVCIIIGGFALQMSKYFKNDSLILTDSKQELCLSTNALMSSRRPKLLFSHIVKVSKRLNALDITSMDLALFAGVALLSGEYFSAEVRLMYNDYYIRISDTIIWKQFMYPRLKLWW